MEELGPPVGVAAAITETGLVVGYAPPTGFSRATVWVLESDAPSIELELSRDALTPVLARCFDAASQVAEDLAGRGGCVSAARTPAARADTTTGTITLHRQGSPVVGVDVRVRVEPIDESGFHFHDLGDRPGGRFVTEQGFDDEIVLQTDGSGVATFRYQSAGLSGFEDLIAEFGPPTNPIADSARLFIALPLPSMPRSGGLAGDSSGLAEYTYVVDVVGRHGADTDNGATSEAQAVILQIFNRYVELYGASGFQDDGRPTTPNNGVGFVITEASLPHGGLFDVGPELGSPVSAWRNPHQFHRAGWDFDVRVSNIPGSHHDSFEEVCEEFGAICAFEFDHYHIYVDHERRKSEGFKNG